VRATVEAGRVVFESQEGDGGDAYVDSDQLPTSGEVRVEAVRGGCAVEAARVYAARAATLAALLRTVDGPLEIIGNGITARGLRSLIPASSLEGPPGVVVDLTGDPANVAAATRRLRDLGTLFLAGFSGGRSLDLELYPDVHLRGLRVVGAPLDVDLAMTPEWPPELKLEGPRVVRLGQPTPLGPAWFQVSQTDET